MSSPSTHPTLRTDAAEATVDERVRTLLGTARDQVLKPLRVVGFWSAVALPFLYVPLVAAGLESTAELSVFLTLLTANVVAIALGHSHSPA